MIFFSIGYALVSWVLIESATYGNTSHAATSAQSHESWSWDGYGGGIGVGGWRGVLFGETLTRV